MDTKTLMAEMMAKTPTTEKREGGNSNTRGGRLTGLRVSLSAARPRSTIPKTPIYPAYVGIGTRVERRRATTSTTMTTMTMCHPAQNHGQGCHH